MSVVNRIGLTYRMGNGIIPNASTKWWTIKATGPCRVNADTGINFYVLTLLVSWIINSPWDYFSHFISQNKSINAIYYSNLIRKNMDGFRRKTYKEG